MNKGEYKDDREWSDDYIKDIISKVADILICHAPDLTDMKEATDLMLFAAKDKRVAARVRRPGYAKRYPGEFTVRSKRDSGSKTEMEKVIQGFADYMFYGHASESEPGIVDYYLVIDLDVFRYTLGRQGYKGWAWMVKNNGKNKDGTQFLAFDIKDFPPEMVIKGAMHD